MSDTYNYEDGAIHNDHKKVLHIDKLQGVDLQKLIHGFFSDDAEEAEVVEEIRNEASPASARQAPEPQTPMPKVKPEQSPADVFVDRVKAIVMEMSKKNGETIHTKARGHEDVYVFFVDGVRISKMMDDLRENYEEKINDFLNTHAKSKKYDGVMIVAPFIGKLLKMEELRARNLQWADLEFAFKPYYKESNAVRRLSIKLNSSEADFLFNLLIGIQKKYPKG